MANDLNKEAIRVKKIFSVCLALILLLACVSLQTSAEGTPTFAAGTAVIENNPGIVGLNIVVSFDRSALTLQSATDALLFSDTPTVTFGGNYDTDAFHIIWENGTSHVNLTNNGTLATLTFLVNEDAPIAETTITVSYTSAFDVDLTDVAFETRNGAVTVTPLEVGGWSFAEGSTLYTYEAITSDLKFVCGLDIFVPMITGSVETTGGWTYAVEPNEFSLESTGAKLVIYDENNDVVEEYYAVLFGDINGDATFDLTDVSLLADAMGYTVDENEPWSGFVLVDEYPQSFAADPSHDMSLDLTDMGMLADHLGYLQEIDQSPWW